MSKWDRLIEYLKTTSAKPDAVLASVKAMWPVKGKKEIKYTDSYIIRKTWAYVVCHKIYNSKGKIDLRIRDWILSEGYKINFNSYHLIKKRNPKTKKTEYYGDEKGFSNKTNEQHYNAVKKVWNTNKKIRAELDKTEGAMPGASMAVLMNHLQTN
jgi:hypothetical protein